MLSLSALYRNGLHSALSVGSSTHLPMCADAGHLEGAENHEECETGGNAARVCYTVDPTFWPAGPASCSYSASDQDSGGRFASPNGACMTFERPASPANQAEAYVIPTQTLAVCNHVFLSVHAMLRLRP
jgi:hypothetical protein